MPSAFRVLTGVALFCTGMLAAAPATVVIRVPTGATVPAELARLLSQWRQSGQVARALYLTEGRAEKLGRPAKFAALAVLDFASDESCEAWQKAAAPVLPAGLIVRRADVLTHGESAPRGADQGVFIVNTYTPLVVATRFNEFVQGYVRPLYEAMRETGHLVRYTAYLERGETGKVDALNVLEYRDQAAFTAMGMLKAGIREKAAAATPSYGQFDKIKDTLRIDGFGTFATWTELPAP